MLKRKDDIRRRLTIAEVPNPPVDLMRKIKRDIPKHYTSKTAKQAEAQQKRESLQLWNIWGFSWQLAAAILVLIGLTWATFEAWQTEVVRTAQIAESDSSEARDALKNAPAAAPVASPVAVGDEKAEEQEVSLNERFDSQAGGHDDSAAGADVERQREQRLDEVRALPPSAPAASEPRQTRYAPEPAGESTGRRSKANTDEVKQVATQSPAGSMNATELVDAPAEKPTVVAAAEGGTTGAAVGGVVEGTITEAPGRVAESSTLSKDDRAAAKSAPALSFASRENADAEVEEDNAATYEVVVKGLTSERIVKVEVQLDASGKVVELSVPGSEDPSVIEAVTNASKEWLVAADRDASGSKGQTKVIDVRLRPDK